MPEDNKKAQFVKDAEKLYRERRKFINRIDNFPDGPEKDLMLDNMRSYIAGMFEILESDDSLDTINKKLEKYKKGREILEKLTRDDYEM